MFFFKKKNKFDKKDIIFITIGIIVGIIALITISIVIFLCCCNNKVKSVHNPEIYISETKLNS